MVVEIAQNVSNLPGIIGEIGQIVLWLQALGIIFVVWIVAEAFAFYYNRKRMIEVYKIKEDMKRIEGKIDKILDKKR